MGQDLGGSESQLGGSPTLGKTVPSQGPSAQAEVRLMIDVC